MCTVPGNLRSIMISSKMPGCKKSNKVKRSKFIDDAASEASDCDDCSHDSDSSVSDEETLEDRQFINDEEEVVQKRSKKVHISAAEKELDADDHRLVLEAAGLCESGDSSGDDCTGAIWKDSDEDDYDEDDAGFIVPDDDIYEKSSKSRGRKYNKNKWKRTVDRDMSRNARVTSGKQKKAHKLCETRASIKRQNTRILVSDGSEEGEVTSSNEVNRVQDSINVDENHDAQLQNNSYGKFATGTEQNTAQVQHQSCTDDISHILKDHFYDGYINEEDENHGYFLGIESNTGNVNVSVHGDSSCSDANKLHIETERCQKHSRSELKLAHIFIPGSTINRNQIFKKVPSSTKKKITEKKQVKRSSDPLPLQSGIYVRKDGSKYYMDENGRKEERGMLYDD